MLVVRPHFALAIPTASRAQDGAGPDAPAAADPIELAARHVQVWETAGERWAILSGEAAVLQAGDGAPRPRGRRPHLSRFRSRTAKATRPKSTRRAKSVSRHKGDRHDLGFAPCFGPESRSSFAPTTETAPGNGRSHRGDLLIVRRSGFVLPEPAEAEPAGSSTIETGWCPSCRGCRHPPHPVAATQVATPTVTESVPSTAAAAETLNALPPPDLPPLEPVPQPTAPRKDPELQLAQFERKVPVVSQDPETGPGQARRAG